MKGMERWHPSFHILTVLWRCGTQLRVRFLYLPNADPMEFSKMWSLPMHRAHLQLGLEKLPKFTSDNVSTGCCSITRLLGTSFARAGEPFSCTVCCHHRYFSRSCWRSCSFSGPYTNFPWSMNPLPLPCSPVRISAARAQPTRKKL